MFNLVDELERRYKRIADNDTHKMYLNQLLAEQDELSARVEKARADVLSNEELVDLEEECNLIKSYCVHLGLIEEPKAVEEAEETVEETVEATEPVEEPVETVVEEPVAAIDEAYYTTTAASVYPTAL